MVRRALPLVVVATVLTIQLTAQSEPTAPFGIPIGASLAELEKLAGPLAPHKDGIHQTSSKVPRPHPSFEAYQFLVSPQHGVCQVGAIGVSIRMNDFGDQLKAAFADVRGQLESRYGKPTLPVDRLTPGSIWKDPNDWAMALFREERTLGALWENPPSAPDLRGITLVANALNTSTGYLTLSYESTNSQACEKEAAATKANVF